MNTTSAMNSKTLKIHDINPILIFKKPLFIAQYTLKLQLHTDEVDGRRSVMAN